MSDLIPDERAKRVREYLAKRREVTPFINGERFDTIHDIDLGSMGHVKLLASDLEVLVSPVSPVTREALEALFVAHDPDERHPDDQRRCLCGETIGTSDGVVVTTDPYGHLIDCILALLPVSPPTLVTREDVQELIAEVRNYADKYRDNYQIKLADVMVRAAGALEALAVSPPTSVTREALEPLAKMIAGFYHNATDPFDAAGEILEALAVSPPAEVEWEEWAQYFERVDSTVGAPKLTGELVAKLLRGPKPFGCAAGVLSESEGKK